MPDSDRQPDPTEEHLNSHDTLRDIYRSFHNAWEGVEYCFNTQRHMRVHFTFVTLVLLASWTLGVDGHDFMLLISAMALVLVAEMINTVAEATIELIIQSYDPRAKIAKDVAAGAVLIAALYALVVAMFVFSRAPRVEAVFMDMPEPVIPPALDALQLFTTGAILLGILITWLKRATKSGTFWRGGAVSGHSALGFLGAVGIMVLTRDLAVMILVLAMAVLLMQSRLQARIHSVQEVLLGGLFGALTGLVLYIWYLN